MYIHYDGRELYVEPDNRVFRINDVDIWFKGYFFIDNDFYKDTSAADYLYKLYKSAGLYKTINRCNGIFTCIIIEKGEIIICNDRFGFGQLFYKTKEQEYFISDDYWKLQDKSKTFEIDAEGVLEILQIRYVLDERTLLKDLNWILPSSVYRFRNIETGFAVERDEYWNFEYKPENYTLEEASLEVYEVLNRIITKYLAFGFGNSAIGINLTGGLDSRFILGLLIKNGINPITLNTFTYGSKKCDDIEITQQIACDFGINHQSVIFNDSFYDFFQPETINEILHKVGYSTSYLQGYGISHVSKLYEGIDYLLTGSDGFFVGLMANEELFSIKDKTALVNYIYKKNATILSPSDISSTYSGNKTDLENSLKQKISKMLKDDNTDYISMFYDWTIKNRLRKYILSIYEILNEKTTALFPFYDYEFLDCMAKLPYHCLKNQEAYFNALFKYVLTEKIESLKYIPIEARRKMYQQGDAFFVERKNERLHKKILRKLFTLPDISFPFPIYKTYKMGKGVFIKKISLLFDKSSKLLKPENSLSLINKYKHKEHFFRYGLIAIITIFRFEQLIKEKIEKR